jgi:hypothetical protein
MNKAGGLSRLIKVLPNFTLLQINGVPSGKNGLNKAKAAYWQKEDSGKNKKLADYFKGVNSERSMVVNRLQLPREKRPQGLNERERV